MQTRDDTGCLTQRTQLERLQEIADAATRERVKSLEGTAVLATTAFVIGRAGKESVWELDHLPLARSAQGPAVQLVLDTDAVLDNLVPTHALMRILRDTDAAAVAVVSAVNVSAAAIQLADDDHEESLTARIVREPDTEPTLGKWDFGKVAWTVRLRHVLRAARSSAAEEPDKDAPERPQASAVPPTRPAESSAGRRNHRREMREQLHRQPAAAPSWLQ
jgi:hypothetical protein